MFSFFKKKKVEKTDSHMMPAFYSNGGYEKKLDVMAWQLGWQVAKNTKEQTPDKSFQDLYYGGGSPFPFDEKTFKLAWKVSKENSCTCLEKI